jgi:uncharacterized membrane protein
MSARTTGFLLFALLFVAIALAAVGSLSAYLLQASESGGMQSVAGGFGLFAVVIPMAVVVAIPLCSIVIILAFRSRRRNCSQGTRVQGSGFREESGDSPPSALPQGGISRAKAVSVLNPEPFPPE